MKKRFVPFTFVALLAYACGGGTDSQADIEEGLYKECMSNMETTHGDTYPVEAQEEYCECAVATYMETFSANDRALMGYGMSDEQAAQYEAALAPCREQLEGSEIAEPEETETTE